MEYLLYIFAFLFSIASLASSNILYLVAGISFAMLGILVEILKKGVDTYHLSDED